MAKPDSPQPEKRMGNDDQKVPSAVVGDVTPNPDPTRLTTAQLIREIDSLRQLFDAKIGSTESKIDALRSHVDLITDEVKESTRYMITSTQAMIAASAQANKELR